MTNCCGIPPHNVFEVAEVGGSGKNIDVMEGIQRQEEEGNISGADAR